MPGAGGRLVPKDDLLAVSGDSTHTQSSSLIHGDDDYCGGGGGGNGTGSDTNRNESNRPQSGNSSNMRLIASNM